MHSVDEDKEYPCLIRLTNGKDVNYSTHVRPSFQFDRYLVYH